MSFDTTVSDSVLDSPTTEKTAVVTVVSGWYHDYVPLFIYSVLKAYPTHWIVILSTGKVPLSVQKQLESLQQRGFDRFSLHEELFSGCPHIIGEGVVPYYLRWLIPYELIAPWDFAFICDVDLVMLPETPSMVDRRKLIMDGTRLPFANFVRPPHQGYPNRMSGWHFINVARYYDRVGPIILRHSTDASFDIRTNGYAYDNSLGHRQWGQEGLLYTLLKEAFDFNDLLLSQELHSFGYHHGLHLGPLRGNIHLRLSSSCPEEREQARKQLGPNLCFWTDGVALRELRQDQLFQECCAQVEQGMARTIIFRLLEHVTRFCSDESAG